MKTIRELTPLAIVLGVIIGVVFGAANAFIGMKVGMTVSASIPAAVISMGIMRGLLKRGTILENNMVQTIGSAGESLAAGMIFTVPALFILAYTDNDKSMIPQFIEMVIWGSIGGLLGVVFMVPLRRLLIVKEKDNLPFPEGTACAEVLESGQRGGLSARTVFAGLGVGAVYEFFRGLGFWRDEASQRLPLIKTDVALATEPALLGVGYILGARIAGYMLGGAVLGWFVIIPAIAYFGADSTSPLPPETIKLISQMDPGDMWNRYLRYIGAGAVVLGGLVSLLKSFGTIGSSLFHMVGGRRTGERTDRDLPAIVLLLLVVGIGAALWYLPTVTYDTPDGPQHLLHGILRSVPIIACIIGFGFFFVTVSSRLVGIVGSSSNPASGMTIATLLGTALVLVYGMGLSGPGAKVAIITVGAFVCIAICIAGDCSQDLKTGYLVKATPWKQQIGEIIGVLTAAAVISGVIYLCNDRYGFLEDAAHPNALLAPQANLMKLLVEGVVDRHLPWALILAGVASALVVELLGLPSLPFAVGLYLPLSLSTPIMVGGVLRWIIDRRRAAAIEREAENPGVLAASGLVAGQGIVGVAFVGVAALIGWIGHDPRFVAPKFDEAAHHWASFSPELDTWTFHDDTAGTDIYYDEKADKWVQGTPPAPTPEQLEKAKLRGELVVPKHFYPWLTTKVGFLQPEYGLREYRLERGPFTGLYAVDWYTLLPLVPFMILVIWLAWTAAHTPPPLPVPVLERISPAPGDSPESTAAPPPKAGTSHGVLFAGKPGAGDELKLEEEDADERSQRDDSP